MMKRISFDRGKRSIDDLQGVVLLIFMNCTYVLIKLEQLGHSRNLNVGRFCLNNLIY